jgi:lactoylglutathione lyase
MARLDHIVINASDIAASVAFYDAVAPVIGFTKEADHIYRNAQGAALDVRQANEPELRYERHGPGVNHIAIAVDSEIEVDEIVRSLAARGVRVPATQRLEDAYAVFIPDPDGLRVEISFEP